MLISANKHHSLGRATNVTKSNDFPYLVKIAIFSQKSHPIWGGFSGTLILRGFSAESVIAFSSNAKYNDPILTEGRSLWISKWKECPSWASG